MKETSMVLVKPRQFIEGKRAEIAEGQGVIADLVKTRKHPKRLAEARRRVKFMKRFITLVDDGFIPLPRMERTLISEDTDLPADAITALVFFRARFDNFAIVSPNARGMTLDPMLIGIIASNRTEEHFLLGWWRPDLISPSQLW